MQFAERMPSMAQEIGAVVNVLTHRERRAAYDAVRKLRDEVTVYLASRLGAD